MRTESKKEPIVSSLIFSKKAYKIIKCSTIIFLVLKTVLINNWVNKNKTMDNYVI